MATVKLQAVLKLFGTQTYVTGGWTDTPSTTYRIEDAEVFYDFKDDDLEPVLKKVGPCEVVMVASIGHL